MDNTFLLVSKALAIFLLFLLSLALGGVSLIRLLKKYAFQKIYNEYKRI